MREKVSDLIIKKAVDLWCKQLHNPVFDNGDTSNTGLLTTTIVSAKILLDKDLTSNMASRIEKFRYALTSDLIRLRDNPGAREYFETWLTTDYEPCRVLARAADAAGIPTSQFSCKSTVSLHVNLVSASFGYGAPYTNYIPLSNGKWLVTTLSGTEMDKVIESVLNGNPLNLTVED